MAWSYCQAAGILAKRKTNQLEQFKKKSLLAHKEIKIKINKTFNEGFCLCKLEVQGFLLVPWLLRHLSRAICSPAPSPNRLANHCW